MFLGFDTGTSRRIETFRLDAARAATFTASAAPWRRLAHFE
jgi:hypothetical protein